MDALEKKHEIADQKAKDACYLLGWAVWQRVKHRDYPMGEFAVTVVESEITALRAACETRDMLKRTLDEIGKIYDTTYEEQPQEEVVAG